ncbi:MAG TPA: protein kinase [Bryobacteraceae bacterium]|nr:protein kinase [Bryobacteraceae bacterium]
MPLAAGTRLGPYEILAPIGAGGMGEVWKARDTRLDRIVAIKRLKGHEGSASSSARFQQEARAIAALNHPHICQIYDVGPDYLVMEYVEGRPLSGPLPLEEALKLALQIASALEEAHGRGILHRDLKPGNILVTGKGAARESHTKLLDFGLAKLMTGSDSDVTATLEGTVMGTASYMAPEQAEGKPLDARSDVFSFGAVLYEMLSGNRAFGGTSMAQVVSAVLRDEPAPLPAALKTPPELDRLVRRCLRKTPAERFQSMAEVKGALGQISLRASEEQPSIAVLPFANMSADKDQEYFSDGLAEEIINALVKIPGLKVIARTSAFAFKGQNTDVRRIAEALGVAHVLEGSVRRAGNRIRVTAQLITAADGSHLWSERYDRELEDVFAVQDEIASAIAGALQVTLAVEPAALRRYTPKLAAYEAYLKGHHYQFKLTPESVARAKAAYQQAIALDPNFALAHVGHGDYFLAIAAIGLMPAKEAMPLVREHARMALDIDPSLAEAHAQLGIVAGVYDYDWKEAERRFQRAMAPAPASAQVRLWHAAFFLTSIGRPHEAARELRHILRDDPLNIVYHWDLAAALLVAGQPSEGSAELRHILELDENFWYASLMLGIFHALNGAPDEALGYAQRAHATAPFAPQIVGLLAGVLMRTGETGLAEEMLHRLQPGEAYMAPAGLAIFHLVCGEIDLVAHWVEKAIEQRDPMILFVVCRAFGKALRSSARWPALAKMMNLPDSVS